MVRFAVAAVLVTACYSPTPHAGAPCPDGVCPTPLVCSQLTMTCENENNPGIDATVDDASTDAPPLVTADARQCFGSGLGTFCLQALPTSDLTIASDTTLDTDSSPLCVAYTSASSPSYCVIAGTNVFINSKLTAIGSKPLVVIGTSTVSISSTLDVSSHRFGAVRGAGGNSSACVFGDAAGAGQGGPGGSFGGTGGIGGNGEQGGTKPNPSAAATTPTTLRGGCRGRSGSLGPGSTPGGNGGGGVYVIAGSSIAITGTINASGASGTRSATNEEGGSGGGSGGMIALEAPSITGSGQVFANGAGGGAGNDNSNNAQEPSTPLTAALGGPDNDDTGDGGDGAAGATLTGGNGGTGGDGGGGGGGGAGVIRVFPSQPLTLVVSPPVT